MAFVQVYTNFVLIEVFSTSALWVAKLAYSVVLDFVDVLSLCLMRQHVLQARFRSGDFGMYDILY